MIDILKDLYLGNIRPFERGECQDPEYIGVMDVISKEFEYFKGVLNEEDYKRFVEFEALCTRAAEITMADVFKAGYSLATKLLISSLNSSEGIDGAEPLKRLDVSN
jgi:hypothetical protein